VKLIKKQEVAVPLKSPYDWTEKENKNKILAFYVTKYACGPTAQNDLYATISGIKCTLSRSLSLSQVSLWLSPSNSPRVCTEYTYYAARGLANIYKKDCIYISQIKDML
jgi:hypothetical protein